MFEYPKKNPPERETQKKNINKKGRGVPNEFDNVIMVAIVITCRANEKEEERKRGGGTLTVYMLLVHGMAMARTIRSLLAAVYNNERSHKHRFHVSSGEMEG